MPTARTRRQVSGKEIYLAVKKPGGADHTVVGCAEDIEFSSAKESVKYSCRSGSGKLPSGEDAEWSVSVKGFYFIYAAGDKATNVSFDDFMDWHLADAVVSIKVFTDKTADPVITGDVFVKDIKLAAPMSGLATYDSTLDGAAAWTKSVSL